MNTTTNNVKMFKGPFKENNKKKIKNFQFGGLSF